MERPRRACLIPEKHGYDAEGIAFEIAIRTTRRDPSFQIVGPYRRSDSTIVLYHSDDAKVDPDYFRQFTSPVVVVGDSWHYDGKNIAYMIEVDDRIPEEVLDEVRRLLPKAKTRAESVAV